MKLALSIPSFNTFQVSFTAQIAGSFAEKRVGETDGLPMLDKKDLCNTEQLG